MFSIQRINRCGYVESRGLPNRQTEFIVKFLNYLQVFELLSLVVNTYTQYFVQLEHLLRLRLYVHTYVFNAMLACNIYLYI